MKLAATRALSSLRPLRLCGELKIAVYACLQYTGGRQSER
jgi:hypothetical protein